MQFEEIIIKSKNSDFYFELISVKSCRFSEPTAFTTEDSNSFWLILSGSGTFYSESKPELIKKYSRLTLISENSTSPIHFIPSELQTTVLYVQYNLYVAVDIRDELSSEQIPVINKKYQLLEHEFAYNIKTAEAISAEVSDYIQDTVKQIKEERLDSHRLYTNLQYIITVCAKRVFKDNIRVLDNVSGVALYLPPASAPLKKEIALDMSDIYIGVEKKKQSRRDDIVFNSESKFIERPDKPELYSFQYTPTTPTTGYCHFESYDKNAFKVWFFRRGMSSTVSVLDMLDSGVISFRMRSNISCELCLQLYNIPSYNDVTYFFKIEQPNVWTDYKIPLKKNQQQHKNSATVQALKYIREHYYERITVTDIASYALVNPNYLSGIFHRDVGQTIPAYINFCRINLAKQLLSETDDSITNIASRVGYFDSAHFLKTFKKIVGVSPKEYRKSYKAK